MRKDDHDDYALLQAIFWGLEDEGIRYLLDHIHPGMIFREKLKLEISKCEALTAEKSK